MTYQYLQIQREDGIAILLLHRPDKRNAMSPTMLGELRDAALAEDRNPQTRVVVITGSGDTSFCAGFDISELKSAGGGTPGEETGLIEEAYGKLRQIGKPLIAMINGVTMGAACDLLTNCDFRFAAEEARLAIPPARLGILYTWEGTRRFIQLVGPANAKDLFMSGRTITAAEALAMGLVHRVVPRARLREETLAYARQLIEAAPLSVAGAKRIVDVLMAGQGPGAEEIRALRELQTKVWSSKDAQEGSRAFLEKRKPVFRGE